MLLLNWSRSLGQGVQPCTSLSTFFTRSLSHRLSHLFPPILKYPIFPKPLGSSNFEMCYMSHDTFHMSHVMCSFFLRGWDNMAELVGGRSVINRVIHVFLLLILHRKLTELSMSPFATNRIYLLRFT